MAIHLVQDPRGAESFETVPSEGSEGTWEPDPMASMGRRAKIGDCLSNSGVSGSLGHPSATTSLSVQH